MKKYIVGITGASGSILSKNVIERLSTQECELNIVATDNGKKVFYYETDILFDNFLEQIKKNIAKVIIHQNDELFSPIASGSYYVDCMIILPCSMVTVGKIANGVGDNLLCRAADVCLKEKIKLVIVPRETPLSAIHLKNLLTLSQSGAEIFLPVPMFYSKRQTLEEVYNDISGRILKSGGIESQYFKWRG